MKPKNLILLSLILLTGYTSLASALINPGDTLNPVITNPTECPNGPTDPTCIVTLPSGGSGWSLTGNTGTTAGTNFIGTTDTQDFVIKTNGIEIGRFGQIGNISLGTTTVASSDYSIALGLDTMASGYSSTAFGFATTASGFESVAFGNSTIASGDYSTAFGISANAIGLGSTAFGSSTVALGDYSIAFGDSTNATGVFSTVFGNGGLASGADSTSFGSTTTASGQSSTAFGESSFASGNVSISAGNNTFARSFSESAFGMFNIDYIPISDIAISSTDRLFSIGNGIDLINRHNAYTLWKDGSFAYNDDNFQNDNPGTEQNMFYFNYGNHDGLGGVNTKRAIRLGSVYDDGWDINSVNVGNNSVAIGFDDSGFGAYPYASGENSIALGWTARAEGNFSFASSIGIARGESSIAISGEANGPQSRSFGGIATGNNSTSIGVGIEAFSFMEVSTGSYSTGYTPNSLISWDTADRLFVIGGGGDNSTHSDALTILKSGQTGIAIDNFEANTNGNIFQVGDGSTGIIGYVDNGTGNWMAVSDERKKHNITDITYGLNEILQLKPVSFDYNRNNEHTIGFLAQQVLPIIPEAVGGDEEKGYSMSYATLTPAIVKAIQELNLKVDVLSLNTGTSSISVFDSFKNWMADTANGIQKIFAHEIQTDKLCVGNTCVTESQLQQLLQNQNSSVTISSSPSNQIDPGSSNTSNTSGDTLSPSGTTTSINTGSSSSTSTTNPPVSDTQTDVGTTTPIE